MTPLNGALMVPPSRHFVVRAEQCLCVRHKSLGKTVDQSSRGAGEHITCPAIVDWVTRGGGSFGWRSDLAGRGNSTTDGGAHEPAGRALAESIVSTARVGRGALARIGVRPARRRSDGRRRSSGTGMAAATFSRK